MVLMMDNLFRWKFTVDSDPGESRSKQMNTLPITLQGLPIHSQLVESCHVQEICDQTDDCPCKQDRNMTKDDINLLVELEPEEKEVRDKFHKLFTWGYSNLFAQFLEGIVFSYNVLMHILHLTPLSYLYIKMTCSL